MLSKSSIGDNPLYFQNCPWSVSEAFIVGRCLHELRWGVCRIYSFQGSCGLCWKPLKRKERVSEVSVFRRGDEDEMYTSARGVWEIRRKITHSFLKITIALGGEQFATAGSLWGPSSCWKHLVLTQAITTKGQFTTSPSNTSSTKIHFRSG